MRPILNHEAYLIIARNDTLITDSRYGTPIVGGGPARNTRRFMDLRIQFAGSFSAAGGNPDWQVSLEGSFDASNWFNVNDLVTAIPATITTTGVYELPGYWGHLRMNTVVLGNLVQGTGPIGVLDALPFDAILGGYDRG